MRVKPCNLEKESTSNLCYFHSCHVIKRLIGIGMFNMILFMASLRIWHAVKVVEHHKSSPGGGGRERATGLPQSVSCLSLR